MKPVIKFEFYRAFRSGGFYVALLLGTALAIGDIVLFHNAFRDTIDTKVVMQTWIGTDYQFVTNSLFYALLPILAALPYAGTYYEDIKTGYLKNILLHTSRRGYYMAKSFVVFVMAAITVMIPLLLDLMAVMTIYPLRMPERLEFLSAGILDVNLFSGLYETNGALYALAFILLDGLFAGLLALVSVCVAERVESMFSAIVIPFAFYIMWSTVMMENNDGRFSVMEMLNPRQSVVFSRLQVVLMAADYYTLAVLKGKEKRRVMIEVELKNISKTIHKTPILHDINLKFHSGAIYGLKGKNGCGKTMLMRTICGLMIPSTGTVSINGKVLMKDIEFPESIGALIENPAFLPQYTGYKNLCMLASLRSDIDKEAVAEAMRRVQLDPEDKRVYRKYSLGMKQKLGIANAIMGEPDIIVLDEPINALDEASVEQVKKVLVDLRERDHLIIIACHDREELEYLSDEIIEIKDGTVVRKQKEGVA